MLDMIADYLGQPRPSLTNHADDTGESDQHNDTCDLDLTTPLFDQPAFDHPDGPLFDEPADTDSCGCPSAGSPISRPGRVSTRAVLAVTVTLAELRAALAGHAGAGGGMLDTGVAADGGRAAAARL